MTDKEKAEEYSDNLDLVKERNPKLKTNDDFIKQAYLDGLAEGMKKVCEICEQHMLEEHPNACGCAFRRLGNEYCWENDKK